MNAARALAKSAGTVSQRLSTFHTSFFSAYRPQQSMTFKISHINNAYITYYAQHSPPSAQSDPPFSFENAPGHFAAAGLHEQREDVELEPARDGATAMAGPLAAEDDQDGRGHAAVEQAHVRERTMVEAQAGPFAAEDEQDGRGHAAVAQAYVRRRTMEQQPGHGGERPLPATPSAADPREGSTVGDHGEAEDREEVPCEPRVGDVTNAVTTYGVFSSESSPAAQGCSFGVRVQSSLAAMISRLRGKAVIMDEELGLGNAARG
ncbi:hypothetical protein FA95DRAFT_1574800 [Auriscalpium vulgare]|uniref:Uncharacterized protein n=1 Tax=Auriscalpium vulgare TaxID=40419 RepID=A0ACB8RIP5_9AGAM|nr:hypothetical protein FA95DRAFT_1574800 [Auriscalpium vulgare]